MQQRRLSEPPKNVNVTNLGPAGLDSNLEMSTGHMDISAELMAWTMNNDISIDELLINYYRKYQQSSWSSQDWGADEEYSWKHCCLPIHEKNLRRASLYSTGYSWQVLRLETQIRCCLLDPNMRCTGNSKITYETGCLQFNMSRQRMHHHLIIEVDRALHGLHPHISPLRVVILQPLVTNSDVYRLYWIPLSSKRCSNSRWRPFRTSWLRPSCLREGRQ